MTVVKKHAVKAVLASLLALLVASCRTGPVEQLRLPHVDFQKETLAECVNQVKNATTEMMPNKVPLTIAIDHLPATLVWRNISSSNSNEASRLESMYIHDTQEWAKKCNTHRISFSANWMPLFDIIQILADMSGGGAYSCNGKSIIRYGSPRLVLHQYSHKGWYSLMDERRSPDNAQHLSDLMMPCLDAKAYIAYVPETDCILVLGTEDQQSAFRKLMEDSKCK